MAYDDSEALQPNSTYSLGGYSFELKVQTVHEPGEEDVVSVFAICRSPDGTRETVPMDFPSGTTVESWTVEANETEATVYATIKKGGISGVNQPLVSTVIYNGMPGNPTFPDMEWHVRGGDGIAAFDGRTRIVARSQLPSGQAWDFQESNGRGQYREQFALNSQYTYRGQTVYYSTTGSYAFNEEVPGLGISAEFGNIAATAWALVYGSDFDKEQEYLIARFAIDLREADGGSDDDWDEPGDVGPDPEKHFTLTVSVTGASVGSNNGIPLEAQEQTTYGSGGYGGNGGGGGAGASTVIIYEFATSKADNVVQEATVQGPGTGGPGGKGGKGGDGCILIFY